MNGSANRNVLVIGAVILALIIGAIVILMTSGGDDTIVEGPPLIIETPTITPTDTITPFPTLTYTPTYTPTTTYTPTPSSTPTDTPTPTITPTYTPSPTPTIAPNMIRIGLQSRLWLETMEDNYAIPNLRAEQDLGFPFGDASLEYHAVVDVFAGVDLSDLSDDDIQVNGTVITITLPNAQVSHCVLNTQESFFYNETCRKEIFGQGIKDVCSDLQIELTEMAQQQAAIYDYNELLDEAFENADEGLTDLILSIVGSQVKIDDVIVVRDPSPLPMLSVDGTCINYAPPTPTPSP